jgi:hypothetical protein
MRRIHPVFIVLIIVFLILVLYVLFAKPTLVLPTVVIPAQPNSAITAYQQQLNINQLDVKIRTNGKMFLLADGRDLGYVSYDPVSLKNGIYLGERVALPPSSIRAISLVPIFFPHLVLNAVVTSQILYFTLPIEITVRFLRG